jgi:Luciferase-like monooxygenase
VVLAHASPSHRKPALRSAIAASAFNRSRVDRASRSLTVLPRPIQQPIPIWVTANPDLNKRRNVEQSYRRVARLGDGWMTTFKSPEDVQTSLAMIHGYSREMGHELKPDFEVAIYHNINVNEDRDGAFAESKRFLDSYYSVDYRQDMLRLWVAAGSPTHCVQSLQRYLIRGRARPGPTGNSASRAAARSSASIGIFRIGYQTLNAGVIDAPPVAITNKLYSRAPAMGKAVVDPNSHHILGL